MSTSNALAIDCNSSSLMVDVVGAGCIVVVGEEDLAENVRVVGVV